MMNDVQMQEYRVGLSIMNNINLLLQLFHLCKVSKFNVQFFLYH